MTYTSRSAILSGFAETLADFGLSPVPFLRNADLPLAALSEPEMKVSSASVVAMLEDTARETGGFIALGMGTGGRNCIGWGALSFYQLALANS